MRAKHQPGTFFKSEITSKLGMSDHGSVGAQLLLRIYNGRSPFLTEQVRPRVSLFSTWPTDYIIPGAGRMPNETMFTVPAAVMYQLETEKIDLFGGQQRRYAEASIPKESDF